MEGLIDFFLSNPFLFIILIGGLLSLFNRDKKEKRDRQSDDRPPSPTTRTEHRQEQPEEQRPNPLEKQFEWAKQLKELVEQELNDGDFQDPEVEKVKEQRMT